MKQGVRHMTINITVWLTIALLASVTANFFAFWYIRRVLGKLMFVGENLSDLVDLLSVYKNHLNGIYTLEQYYGDEDIKTVMSHTTSLIELLNEQYGDILSMVEPMEFEIEEQPEETEQDAKTLIDQENVFYAGTRKRNT